MTGLLNKAVKIKASDGSEYIILEVNSNVSDLRYIYIVPHKIYNITTNSVRLMLQTTIFFCISLGFIIIYIFSRYNYKPLKKIIGYIGYNAKEEETGNEYSLIMEKLLKYNRELLNQQEIVNKNIMIKILNGEINFELISESNLKKYQLNFSGDYFIIGIVEINKVNNYEVNEENQIGSNSLDEFIVHNVLSEILDSSYWNTRFYTIDSRIVIIINYDSEDKDKVNKIFINNLKDVVGFCNQYFKFIIKIGCSTVCNNTKLLPLAYIEAKNSLEYMRIFNTFNICSYSDIPDMDNAYEIELEDENYIIHSVLSGNTENIINYFEKVNVQINNRLITVNSAKYLIYYFYRTTNKLKNKLVERYGSDYPKEIDVIKDGILNNSLNDIIKMLNDIYFSIGEYMAFINSEDEYSIIDEVCNYISNNYSDINLNLNNIAQHYNYSAAYISKKFKNDMNESILDYLYKIRIKNAIHLLLESDLKIADIAPLVGFVDSNSFIRIFKKYEGITPGKYKDIHNQMVNKIDQ